MIGLEVDEFSFSTNESWDSFEIDQSQVLKTKTFQHLSDDDASAL